MTGRWIKRLVLLLVLAAVIAGFYVSMQEKPVLVDLARIESGSMQVTIDEEGVTRVRDLYTIFAPIAGHLNRITLEEGDAVKARDTVIASIHPPDPPFLDDRTRTEIKAGVEAARAAVALAKVEHQRAETAFNLAESEYRRASTLGKTNVISESQLERAVADVRLQGAQVESAAATIRLRNAELASMKARLVQPGDIDVLSTDQMCCVVIHAPVDGVVLKVFVKSEQAVAAGSPILEVGEPSNLEVSLDALSSDAVRIAPGTDAVITDWGGERALSATVRRLDPSAFTKISALGIEEQRVKVILDVEDVPEGLGHGFRIFAQLVVWSADSVLQVPIGSLFRSSGDWNVFIVQNDHANLRQIDIGHMNARYAEILSGLDKGDLVVLYPNDVLEDGSLVEDRLLADD